VTADSPAAHQDTLRRPSRVRTPELIQATAPGRILPGFLRKGTEASNLYPEISFHYRESMIQQRTGWSDQCDVRM